MKNVTDIFMQLVISINFDHIWRIQLGSKERKKDRRKRCVTAPKNMMDTDSSGGRFENLICIMQFYSTWSLTSEYTNSSEYEDKNNSDNISSQARKKNETLTFVKKSN